MLYVDLRLGEALSKDRLQEAENRRLLLEAAAAKNRRLSHRLGNKLVALGERLEDQRDRAA